MFSPSPMRTFGRSELAILIAKPWSGPGAPSRSPRGWKPAISPGRSGVQDAGTWSGDP